MSNRVPGAEPRLYAGDLTTVLAGDYRLDYRKWWSAGGGNTPSHLIMLVHKVQGWKFESGSWFGVRKYW